jgi:hypothetical protein
MGEISRTDVLRLVRDGRNCDEDGCKAARRWAKMGADCWCSS